MRRREFLASMAAASVLPPVGAGAEQSTKVYRIAFLHPSHPLADMTEAGSLNYYRAFFDELRRLGYREGQNLLVERYSAEGHVENYPALARNVVSRNPDLVFTSGVPLTRSLEKATSTIPIVAVLTTDPVAAGLAKSLAQPGGNITGVSAFAQAEYWGKRFQLLREVVPAMAKLGILGPPRTSLDEAATLQEFLQIVDKAGVAVVGPSLLDGTSDADYSSALATMSHQGADSLCVFGSPENTSKRKLIVELAAKFGMPAIYSIKPYVEAGGLMSYGPDLSEIFRYCARSIDKILRGAYAADIPFDLPTKFELVINLGTAKALGLSIPSSVLSLADDLIEGSNP